MAWNMRALSKLHTCKDYLRTNTLFAEDFSMPLPNNNRLLMRMESKTMIAKYFSVKWLDGNFYMLFDLD